MRAEFDRKYASLGVEEAPKSRKVHSFMSDIFFIVHSKLFPKESSSKNIFDNLPALSAPKKSSLRDDLDRYLSTDPEDVTDVLLWWYEHKHAYPHLHRMALDYLSIPGKIFQWRCARFLLVLNKLQLHLYMSNVCLVKAVFCFHTYVVGSPSSQHGHSCVSEFGV